MKWCLVFIFCSLFNINDVFSIDCNPKQLESIIDEFTAKVTSNLPITSDQVIKALEHCTLAPSAEALSSRTGAIEEDKLPPAQVIHPAETHSKLADFTHICDNLKSVSPETQGTISLIVQEVAKRVQKIDDQNRRLESWKRDSTKENSATERRTLLQGQNKFLDFFANADSRLKKQ